MRVVVVGAGEVGETIASNLAEEHEVIVVDADQNRVESLTYSLDILAIEGTGVSASVLDDAGVGEADMVIASTDDDETNLVTCATAKTIADVFTIARVKDVTYLRTWERAQRVFGVDFMVCTNLLAAQDIVRILGLPAARDVDPFAGGLVQMAELDIGVESPIVDQTVREADRWGSLTFAALFRDDAVVIPRGDTVIRSGDRLIVIGSPESVRSSAASIAPDVAGGAQELVIFGGSKIGYHVAELLEDRGHQPRLVEQSAERARELAEALPETVVLGHDAFDVEFLDRERVGEADTVVATLDNDQQNLMVSLLADRLGADRTVAVVEEGAYIDLFEAVGVDVAVNPRLVAAEEITRFTHRGGAEKIAFIENDRAEVLEFEIDADSVLADRPIREAIEALPTSVVIGAITRDGEFVTPRGDTVVRPGDHVVVFVEAADVDAVTGRV